MICIPIYPPRGLEILREHIRLARARCEVQDMATPLTYIWFYQPVRNRGLWDYKQKGWCGAVESGHIKRRMGKFHARPTVRR